MLQSVPNFSEGRREDVIREIIRAASSPGVEILDWSADADHNRCVVTLVGEEEPLLAGLRAMTARAVALIDLREHRGSHPRMGAMDVIPLVPLLGTTMEDARRAAARLAAELAADHGLPVFLYGEAATRPANRDLSRVREGQFEGLAATIGHPERNPDYGPARLHPSAGATAVGARGPLVAFNVNLATADVKLARRIARQVRESSGGLPAVKAIGLALAERGATQVSMNLTDFGRTSLGAAFQAVAGAAEAAGTAVTGSEIIGLVPAEALLAEAARYLCLEDFSPRQVLELRLLDRPGRAGEPEDGRRG